jgi:hypothetical protein
MKCRREWNSFEFDIDKRDILVGRSFKRRNIKGDNNNRVKSLYYTNWVKYRDDNSTRVFKKQGDMKV